MDPAQALRETKAEINAAQKFYSVAKEWRSENLVHRSTSRPHGERDLILKSKDKGRRSETDDGETHVLFY